MILNLKLLKKELIPSKKRKNQKILSKQKGGKAGIQFRLERENLIA